MIDLAPLRRFLDARLQRGMIRFVCAATVVLSLLMLLVMFVTSERGRTFFGPQLGADFANFYNAGRILNLPGPDAERLYDLEFQNQLYHELLPALDEQIINPFVHPPLVAWLFRPLALLPYEPALIIWLFISGVLYIGGFLLLWCDLPALPAAERWDGLLIAVAFEPFIMECWIGGQFAAVAFFFLAAATHFELRGRPFRSGTELGILLYKPTMLVLFLPLLFVARRWKTLAGVAVTGLVMAVLSLVLVGAPVCRAYVDIVLNFTGTTTGTGMVRKEWKWVDFNFFSRLLLGGPSPGQKVLFLLLAVPSFLFLARAWWQLDRRRPEYRTLIWAAAITGTMVVNLYIGLYDTMLIVVGILLTAGVLQQQQGELPAGFRYLLLLVFVSPWLTQPLAALTGLQVYTLVLAGLTAYQLVLAEKIAVSRDLPKAKVESTL